MSAESPKVAAAKVKKSAKPMEHQPVAEMVKSAIASLADKKGSSLAAIKKYVDSNYKGIDMVKIAPFIRRFLKKAVTDGVLVTAKGHAGSFKLGEKAKKPTADKKHKKVTPKKAAKPEKETKPKTKKDAKPKSKKVTPKKAAKATKPKAVKKTAAAKATKPVTVKKPAAAKAAKPKTQKKPAAKTTKK